MVNKRGHLLLGELLLAERVDLVSADSFIEGFSDPQVQACEHLSHRLSLAVEQDRHSLSAIMSNRHAADRAHIADSDLAILQN
jgi:hypothetical protein